MTLIKISAYMTAPIQINKNLFEPQLRNGLGRNTVSLSIFITLEKTIRHSKLEIDMLIS